MGSQLYELAFLFATFLFEFIVVYQYFRSVYRLKASTQKYRYAIVLIVSIIPTLLNQNFELSLLMPASWIVMAMILAFVCFAGSARQFVFECLFLAALSVLSEIMSAFLSLLLFPALPAQYVLEQPFDPYMILTTINGKILWYIILRFIMAKRVKKIDVHQSGNGIRLLNIIPVLVCVFIYGIFFFGRARGDSSFNVFLAMSLGALGIIACFITFRLYESSLRRSELEHELKRVQDEAEYYNAVVQNETILRSCQHEYINTLLTAKGMLTAETEPEAVDYLTQAVAEFGASRELAITADFSNKVVNAILNNNKTICKEHGIDLKIHIEYYDLAFLKPLDTGTLLNNAFNNAVEACRQVPKGSERRIQLKIHRLHDELVIGMKNTKSGDVVVEHGALLSTKPDADADGHGHGIANMKQCAAKYGGSVHIADNGGEFLLTVRLKIRERQACSTMEESC